jgi:hypothetical protein
MEEFDCIAVHAVASLGVSMTRTAERMGMGKRKRSKQDSLFIPTASLARSPSHDFYERLNQVLSADGFDDFVEDLCEPFYVHLTESTPDHSTLSRIRQRLPVEVHDEVFTWILTVLAKADLLKGKTVAVDATTLEANAALRSLQRRDTGEAYQEYLTTLAKASGIETPSRADSAKLDKKRPKKVSNDDWEHPHDPDAKVTKMKDRRTHLAHKAEHTVDLETQAIVAVSLADANEGDTSSLPWSLLRAVPLLTVILMGDACQESGHFQRPTRFWRRRCFHGTEVRSRVEAGGHAHGFGRGQYRSRGGAAPGNQQGRHQSVEKAAAGSGARSLPRHRPSE